MEPSTLRTGRYASFGEHRHYIPGYLPFTPALQMDHDMIDLYGQAMHALGRLDEVRTRIPNKRRLLDVYVTKEALLSSQIEGINTTLTLVMRYKARQKAPQDHDVTEVLHYVDALHYATDQLMNQHMPIVSRLLRETHRILLSHARGHNHTPGEFRTGSVSVGNLVPPPAPMIADYIANLEQYINNAHEDFPLIRAGIIHAQFEMIHPFWDGNGRLGRLLIVLCLLQHGLLHDPLLYPSCYFKKYQSEYYDRLDRIRTHQAWEEWIQYYLRGIRYSAEDVWKKAWQIDALQQQCSQQIRNHISLRQQDKALQLLDTLFHHPSVTIQDVSQIIGTSYNPASRLIGQFVQAGICRQDETTAHSREKSYVFADYIDLLEQE